VTNLHEYIAIKYLLSDSDERAEDDDDKQVVNDTDYSDDAGDYLEHKICEVARLQW